MPPGIVWLRQDLRVSDQRALAAALAEGPVLPVYVLDDDGPGGFAIGGAGGCTTASPRSPPAWPSAAAC
jgi:deoxyribodipyrimidine photo-lyase